MAKTDFQNIDEYQETFPEAIRSRMQTVRNIIKKLVPEAEEVISYQIPAFKIGKKFLIYYAGFENHLSLSSPWSTKLLEQFKDDLKGKKVSKSVIQFPLNEPLPLDFIERLIIFRMSEVK